MRTGRRFLAALCAAGALNCCGMSPEPMLFTLAPVPGPVRRNGPRTVKLRRPGLAGYLDRTEVMRADGQVRFRAVAGARWAEPFEQMLSRVLAEDLGQRMPGTVVFTPAADFMGASAAVLELEVQRFEADLVGQVLLAAQFTVRRTDGRAGGSTEIRSFRHGLAAMSGDLVDVTQAMSQVLGRLADEMAAMLAGP